LQPLHQLLLLRASAALAHAPFSKAVRASVASGQRSHQSLLAYAEAAISLDFLTGLVGKGDVMLSKKPTGPRNPY
jgi:hypothetical protein